MNFGERMKIEDDYYIWLNDRQNEIHAALKDGPSTFLVFLETQGYEVKKDDKVITNNERIPKEAVKVIITTELCAAFDEMLNSDIIGPEQYNEVEETLLDLNKKIRKRVLDWKEGGSNAEN